MKKFFIPLLAFALLSACSSGQVPPAKFSGVPPAKITLDAAAVNIIDHSSVQPSDSPYNKYQLDPTIAQAAHQWLADSVHAAGMTGEALIIIKDASLRAEALPMSQDTMDQTFTRQQAGKYIGHLEVSIEIQGKTGYATANAEATHSVTLPENPNATERQNEYNILLSGLMKDFAQNWNASVREHVHDFMAGGSR